MQVFKLIIRTATYIGHISLVQTLLDLRFHWLELRLTNLAGNSQSQNRLLWHKKCLAFRRAT
jgi:hypothetical protein